MINKYGLTTSTLNEMLVDPRFIHYYEDGIHITDNFIIYIKKDLEIIPYTDVRRINRVRHYKNKVNDYDEVLILRRKEAPVFIGMLPTDAYYRIEWVFNDIINKANSISTEIYIDEKERKQYGRSFISIVFSYISTYLIAYWGFAIVLSLIVNKFTTERELGIKMTIYFIIGAFILSLITFAIVFISRFTLLKHQEKITGLHFKKRNDNDLPRNKRIWFITKSAKILCRKYFMYNATNISSNNTDVAEVIGDGLFKGLSVATDPLMKEVKISQNTIDNRVIIIEYSYPNDFKEINDLVEWWNT